MPFNIAVRHNEKRHWTCVRTRPRWEKKFTRWLTVERIQYFLPLYERTALSCRKRRTTTNPLFPGYVFVAGQYTKQDFTTSGAVAYLLKPRSDQEHQQLDDQLRTLWTALKEGLPMSPTPELRAGQRIEVLEGPLRGTVGRYIRTGTQGALLLSVDMLESAVKVELPPDCRFDILN